MCPWNPKPPLRRAKRGREYQALARRVYEEEDYCGVCGMEVDKSLPWTHPMSKSLGHIVSVAQGGNELDRENCEIQHRRCNVLLGEG